MKSKLIPSPGAGKYQPRGSLIGHEPEDNGLKLATELESLKEKNEPVTVGSRSGSERDGNGPHPQAIFIGDGSEVVIQNSKDSAIPEPSQAANNSEMDTGKSLTYQSSGSAAIQYSTTLLHRENAAASDLKGAQSQETTSVSDISTVAESREEAERLDRPRTSVSSRRPGRKDPKNQLNLLVSVASRKYREKKMCAIYSRRKREKQKIREIQLFRKRDLLIEENKNAIKTNMHLQNLLSQAVSMVSAHKANNATTCQSVGIGEQFPHFARPSFPQISLSFSRPSNPHSHSVSPRGSTDKGPEIRFGLPRPVSTPCVLATDTMPDPEFQLKRRHRSNLGLHAAPLTSFRRPLHVVGFVWMQPPLATAFVLLPKDQNQQQERQQHDHALR